MSAAMLGKGRFTRKIEDFNCINCKAQIIGNGYTDHCPKCLTSIHVDIMPGDRDSECRGIMKAQFSIYKKDSYSIIYKCIRCNMSKEVRAAKEDNLEELIKILSVKK